MRCSNLLAGAFALTLAACATGSAGPDDARHFDAAGPVFDGGVAGDAEVAYDATPSPDAPLGRAGHTVHATVPGGVKAASPGYRLLGTAGHGDATATSPSYRFQGGVVGASQE